MIEYKGLSGGFEDVDTTGRIVTGLFAAFGSRDSDGDIIQKGAFAKTIAERGPNGTGSIRHLLDHDKTKAVGKILSLEEKEDGLHFRSKIGLHTLGLDYMHMCADGLIDSHSIGYLTVKEQKADAYTNILSELKLFEGSGIQFLAANPNTPITGFKSFEDLFVLTKKLDSALHGYGFEYTDDTYLMIEARLKSLNLIINEILAKNSTIEDTNNQPSTDTKPTLEVTLPDDVTIAQVKEEVKKIDYAKLLKTALS